MKDTEYLISQFADDTTLLLDGSEKSLNSVLEILDKFYAISGLKCNFDKPKLIWIGSHKYSAYSIKTKWKLNWGETEFVLLGLTFDVNLHKMIDLNYELKLKNISKYIVYWKRRNLTPVVE